MTDESQQSTTTATPATHPASFREVLEGFIGKVITVVNPESYEAATVGHTLTTGFYRAKVLHIGSDYITLATEFVHKASSKDKEPVRQYMPLSAIKRISLMRTERLIHL
jgi:hypothetical protein